MALSTRYAFRVALLLALGASATAGIGATATSASGQAYKRSWADEVADALKEARTRKALPKPSRARDAGSGKGGEASGAGGGRRDANGGEIRGVSGRSERSEARGP
jgi:hypothetical protein